MGRGILIVGAGQSGLMLAHGLLDHGYDVTVATGSSSTDIRTGRVSVTQLTMPTVRAMEQAADLDLWSGQAPEFGGVRISMRPPQQQATQFSGRFGGGAGVAVDRRLKMADWLEKFEDRGGKVIVHGMTTEDIDFFTRMFDLVVIAVGGGELGNLFAPDARRRGGAHQRVLSEVYLHGVDATGDVLDVVTTPHGEIFLIPVLTAHGPAHSLFMIDVPGGGMDCSTDRPRRPEQVWEAMQVRLKAFAPDLHDRVTGAELVDRGSALVETITPAVRHPVAKLPSCGRVWGLADAVVTADPISGQGWNNSTRCADAYLHAILDHGDRPFDTAFMQDGFARFWEAFGAPSAAFSQMIWQFWRGDLPAHFPELIKAALAYPEIADRWVSGFDDPRDYQTWMFDPDACRAYIAEAAARHT